MNTTNKEQTLNEVLACIKEEIQCIKMTDDIFMVKFK